MICAYGQEIETIVESGDCLGRRVALRLPSVTPEVMGSCSLRRGEGGFMEWTRILAYITGSVDRELLLRNEYLAAENRILRAKLNRRLRFFSRSAFSPMCRSPGETVKAMERSS